MDLSKLTAEEMAFLNVTGMSIFNILSNYLKAEKPIINEKLSIRELKDYTNIHVVALFNDIKCETLVEPEEPEIEQPEPEEPEIEE